MVHLATYQSHSLDCGGVGRSPNVLITVAICTFNRAESLRRTLDSLAAMRLPSDLAWEIVVVNNNSTDHTNDVIGEYFDRLPIRRECEPHPGLSNARNRAIDAAKGKYIVWTDDDVVVGADWLRAYVEAFRRWPDAAVFGGRIIPKFELPMEKWVAESVSVLGGPYAISDFGNDVQPLSVAENRLPYGANFAVGAAEERIFGYDAHLGLAPNRRRLADEFDVITRLLEAGAIGYWVPAAIVEHCIGRERQTIRYIASYSAGLGETDAFRCTAEGAISPLWLGFSRRLWPRVLKRWLYYRFHRLVSPASVWVVHLQSYYRARGMFRYWRERKRRV
jgi:glycosyltransferase involved in cell wall biosynthesis